MARASLHVDTRGAGISEFTREAADFLSKAGAGDGVLFLFMRHTSASLMIQENADPDVRRDLMTALQRLAPEDAGWVHDTEGPDDMPAHVKAMLTGVSLHVPVPRAACCSAPGRAFIWWSTGDARTPARSCCNSSAAGARSVEPRPVSPGETSPLER